MVFWKGLQLLKLPLLVATCGGHEHSFAQLAFPLHLVFNTGPADGGVDVVQEVVDPGLQSSESMYNWKQRIH